MVQLLLRGALEGVDLAALRIDAGHHRPDRRILAGRVHRLEDQQQGPAVVGIEQLLQLLQVADAVGEQGLRDRLVEVEILALVLVSGDP